MRKFCKNRCFVLSYKAEKITASCFPDNRFLIWLLIAKWVVGSITACGRHLLKAHDFVSCSGLRWMVGVAEHGTEPQGGPQGLSTSSQRATVARCCAAYTQETSGMPVMRNANLL